MENDLQEILKKLETGKLSLSRLEKELGNANLAALVRRLFLEKKLGVNLSSIASTILDFVELYGRNIENPIGAVQVPVGIVGPLLVEGEYARGEFYVPLATTEGALVASVARGVKAVSKSGGARVRVLKNRMTRAPVLRADNIIEANRFVEWFKDNWNDLKKVVEGVSRYGRLEEYQVFRVGNLIWLRLGYETGDAMGMNIATLATDKLCRKIEAEYPGEIECIALSGNLCSDKKPAVINRLLGRGKYVIAEALIKGDVIENVLKASANEIHMVNSVKNLMGSAVAGSPSYNAHVANIIAAVFLATGQDMAQVVESSLSFTWTEPRGEDLYISVTLPSLEVGTVGGGTRLPTQSEALSILRVVGGGDPPGVNALKFAEIVGATVLAGELSLLAALAADHLARAHELLGRGGIRGGGEN